MKTIFLSSMNQMMQSLNRKMLHHHNSHRLILRQNFKLQYNLLDYQELMQLQNQFHAQNLIFSLLYYKNNSLSQFLEACQTKKTFFRFPKINRVTNSQLVILFIITIINLTLNSLCRTSIYWYFPAR
jgi:hypothetical protein